MTCSICLRSEQWHRENPATAHPYSPEGGAGKLNAKPKETSKIVSQLGGDPALRLALISAGVITYEDLARAEEALRGARDAGSPIVVAHTPAPAGDSHN